MAPGQISTLTMVLGITEGAEITITATSICIDTTRAICPMWYRWYGWKQLQLPSCPIGTSTEP